MSNVLRCRKLLHLVFGNEAIPSVGSEAHDFYDHRSEIATSLISKAVNELTNLDLANRDLQVMWQLLADYYVPHDVATESVYI